MGTWDVTQRQAMLVGVWCGVMVLLLSLAGLAQEKRQALVTIEHAPFTRPQRRGYPLTIEARIVSPAGIRDAKVYFRQPGARDFTALEMHPDGEQTYRAVVPDWGMTGAALEYYITAVDLLGSSASRGFIGFPLTVRLTAERDATRQERLEVLENALESLRRKRETTTGQGESDGQWSGYDVNPGR
jgi:hypothetical protein